MKTMICNNSVYGNFRTRKFSDIYDKVEKFLDGYENSGIPKVLSDENLTTLFYLLYARYGNSNIASSDENQFKYKVYSTIFMYGPAWQKRLEIQKTITSMGIDEAMIGTTAIYNTALNPSTAPTTQTTDELNYINSQNTTKYKKSKVEALASLVTLIETDVTEEFISKFKKLFITILEPQGPLWYVTEGEQND